MGPALGEERIYRVAAAFETAYAAAHSGLGPGFGAGTGGERPMTGALTRTRRPDGLRRGDRTLRPGARPRGARRTRHRHQDVLRLPDRVRCAAEHPGLPGLPGAARRDADDQPHRGRVRHPDRPGAELHDRVLVPVRPEELLLPGHAEELPDLAVRRADRLRRVPGRRGRRARPCGSRSSARTWRRTPASRCTSAARPAGSPAPSTRCWTTTGPACRWSRSSPRWSPGPRPRRRRWRRPTSRRCGIC